MNNSVFSENKEEKPNVQECIGRLTTLIESAEAVLVSKEWSTLKEKEFDAELNRLKRVLVTEAKKRPVNEPEIYFIQGRIESMERYDLRYMADKWRVELETIKRI